MEKKDFITNFFSLLNKKSIDYFVMGEYDSLPSDANGTDIDIIILNENFPEIIKFIKEWAKGKAIIAAETYNTSGKFKRFRFLGESWGVQIDLFDNGVFFNGIPYYDMKYLKNHVIKHNDIYVLEKTKGYSVGYFKEIVHKAKAKGKYREAVVTLLSAPSNSLKEEIVGQYGQEAFDLVIYNLSVDGLNEIGSKLQTLLTRKIQKKNVTQINKLLKVKRLFNKNCGYSIAVLGTDGSGKSTIINAITPWLEEAFHGGVRYNHLRPNFMPDMAVLMGKRKKPKEGEYIVVSDPHSKKQSGFVGSLVRWGYYLIDYTIGYFKVVWLRIKTHSDVFIFDRYYYDYYIDQKRSRTNLPNWIIRLGECLVPTPDIILCLGGDPEKIYNRKPETSLQEVKRQTKALTEFCNTRRNAVWIDTTLTPEESIREAKKAIFNMMSKRFN